MKFQELRENEPLEVVEVSEHVEKPTFGSKKDSNSDIIEFERIQTIVFTDGDIAQESEETTKNIKQYYIDKEKYQHTVDTLRTKNIHLKNHSYAITCLIASEFMTVENIRGWHNVVKDISIYLKNPNDKKALKSTKQVIKQIKDHNNSIDYSSLLGWLCSQNKVAEKFETTRIARNVYTLRKIK